MKKIFLYIFFLLLSIKAWGQHFSGQIFMKEDSHILLNYIYVTNLNTMKTVLTNYNGEFIIPAKQGDVIRFTSIISARKDVKMTTDMLGNKNFIELKHAYTEIPELVIKFKPTGNLRADAAKLKSAEKSLEIAKMIGLPQGNPNAVPPTIPPVALTGGGLSISVDSIYDLISGEHKKKLRQQKYEKMIRHTTTIRNYYGDEYFTKLKIPTKMIDNFLQFVYGSENVEVYVETNNLESVKPYIEKYIPIYLKRLRNSNLMQIVE